MVAAHELGLAERITPVRTVVGLDLLNEALLADNPVGRIPTLVLDDGTALYDSLVICEYLDSVGAGGLFPPAGPARWTALTWHAMADNLLDVLILWRFEQGRPPARSTPELPLVFGRKTEAVLDRLEQLAPALGAAPFGIGQLTIGVLLAYLDFRFAALAWREGRPALALWAADALDRPSMRATLAEDD